MTDVFEGLEFNLKIKLLNYLLHSYTAHASDSILTADIPKGSRVIDLGCGTGISTETLFDLVEDVSVVGIDRYESPLKIAKFMFGKSDDPETIRHALTQTRLLTEILEKYCGIPDLSPELLAAAERYRKYHARVDFFQRDGASISELGLAPADYVLASQFIHWPRKEKNNAGLPNLEYEAKVLSEVRSALKPQGSFVFNTSGSDYRFDNDRINQMHLTRHPFYNAFMQRLNEALGKISHRQDEYTFDHQEIQRVMSQSGFRIDKIRQSIHPMRPLELITVCLIGAHMQKFQKEGIEMPFDERERAIAEAINYALKMYPVISGPVAETSIHYVTRKV